ncbi:hypothetical protein CORC01_03125, partial [Colletotrichum orchidophilum]
QFIPLAAGWTACSKSFAEHPQTRLPLSVLLENPPELLVASVCSAAYGGCPAGEASGHPQGPVDTPAEFPLGAFDILVSLITLVPRSCTTRRRTGLTLNRSSVRRERPVTIGAAPWMKHQRRPTSFSMCLPPLNPCMYGP